MTSTTANGSGAVASPVNTPLSLEQAATFVQSVDDGKLMFEVALQDDALPIAKLPNHSYLHMESAFSDAKLDASKTKISFVNEDGDQVHGRIFGPFAAFKGFYLEQVKPSPAAGPQANLYASGRTLFFWHNKLIFEGIPLEIPALMKKIADMAQSRPVSSDQEGSPTDPSSAADKESLFYMKDIRYDLSFSLRVGSTLELNEDTSVTVASGGSATVSITGQHDYTVATIIGRQVQLDTSMMSTEPSDVDVRITLNRKPDGMHFIAFNPSVLHGVQFKTTDFSAPPLEKLRIESSDYDFVITINPHDEFTVEMLIDKIVERVGNPEFIAKLRKKLAEQAAGSTGPSEIVIDSARWNIVDYVTHDFKGVFAYVKDLPHIRKDLDDPAIQKLARDGVLHLRAFIISTRLQIAASYDPGLLVEFVKLALSPSVSTALKAYDADALRRLLKAIKVSDSEISSFMSGARTEFSRLDERLQALADGTSDISGLEVESSLRELGNVLNFHERAWLREAMVDVGGLESEGRVYSLTANLVEALATNVRADPEAPESLKEMLKTVPEGEDLHQRIAVASISVRGAIWAAHGVLKDGWLAVSKKLELSVRQLYGENIWGLGTKVFRDCAQKLEAEAFLPGEVRFIGNGEEFFQQIMQLLSETERAFVNEASSKCTIVLSYWSFEAIKDGGGKPNFWGLKVADRLKEMAMGGFVVSIVVDKKNGPSSRGQVYLREIAEQVEEHGKGVFQLHAFAPREERFPTGTHVKYICTPLGVIAGGSNLGDHYAHWSDLNFLMRGRDAVNCFAGHHFAIVDEQRQVGHTIKEVAKVEPLSSDVWNPLSMYQYHKQDTQVFDPDWQDVGVRVFRDLGGDENDRILVECIAALDSARGSSDDGRIPAQTVYIANCYFILVQPLADHPIARALRRALERGVNIEILSNTKDSIDVPVTASPNVESMYFTIAMARDLSKNNSQGRKTGRVTLHLPDAEFVMKDDKGLPEVLIHEKILFVGEFALVKTTNIHPRSFTLEQEMATEMIGSPEPTKGEDHEKFMARARHHLQTLKKTPGGSRIQDIESLLAPVNWQGDIPPELWGPSADLYLNYLEKRFTYCHTFTSDTDEEVKLVESKLDESTQASLADLMMNIF